MQPVDPLNVSHGSLKVIFDGTPRPHLIILERSEGAEFPKLAKDISKKQTESMIKCYEEIKGRLEGKGLKRFTLVTHLGGFATNETYLHAHIWMEADDYKKVLMPTNPSDDYVKGVDGYKKKMSNKHKHKYIKGDRKEVEEAKKKEKIAVTCPAGYEIVFHQCLAYIGFRCKEEKTKADIFYDVTKFANDHQMTEDGDGCNVCLGGQPAIDFDGEAVDAFLLATVGTFYKMLCNDEEANKWWAKFQENIVDNPILH